MSTRYTHSNDPAQQEPPPPLGSDAGTLVALPDTDALVTQLQAGGDKAELVLARILGPGRMALLKLPILNFQLKV